MFPNNIISFFISHFGLYRSAFANIRSTVLKNYRRKNEIKVCVPITRKKKINKKKMFDNLSEKYISIFPQNNSLCYNMSNYSTMVKT